MGSINLSEFVDKDGTFNFEEFRKATDIAVKALNNVLDEGLPLHPLKEQQDCVRDWRQIGLGIFGLADMLIKMKVRYGSEFSIRLCDTIGKAMAKQALTTSLELAEKYGAYPKFHKDKVIGSPFYNKHVPIHLKDRIYYNGLRNSQLLTIAPTGSLSSMLGVSGGIEPIYANYYTRKTESLHGHDEYYKVYTPIVKDYMESDGITDDKDLPDYFVTAQNLNYKERIDMQAVWQKHIDASISSTVNVPNSFTVKDTEDLYMYAWEKGLKGVTIFRDGCKRVGILSTDTSHEKSSDESISKNENNSILPRGAIIKADDNCVGKKRTLTTGCGTLHCEAFFDPDTGALLETYFSKGSTGGCNNFSIGLSRMISLAARGGIDIYSIVDQLQSCGVCPSYAVRKATKHDTSKGSCCPVAISNALMDMYKEMQNDLGIEENEKKEPILKIRNLEPKKKIELKKAEQSFIPCPECGEPLVFEGGCNICKSCGWSKCE